MIRKRRAIGAVVVVTVATIAACLGPSLSTTQQEAIVVQQGSSVNIGDVMVGATGSATITLSPASGSSSSVDQVTSITENCPAFSLVLSPPPPVTVSRTCAGTGTAMDPTAAPEANETQTACTDMTYDFLVNFSPTTAGQASCTVTIQGASFGTLTVQVLGNGVAPTLGMDVQPPELRIGDVRVGTSGSGSAAIRNTGTATLNVTGLSISPNASAYALNPPAPFTVAPNSTRFVNVVCTPPEGSVDGKLTVTSNAGMASVNLVCRGVVSNLDLTPSPTDVTARVGEEVIRTVMVRNAGSASATIESYTIEGATSPITIVNPVGSAYTLFPGSGSSITVRHAPTAPTASQSSTQLARLRVTHDGTAIREIPLNGAALETSMQVFPDRVEFGPVCAGTTETRDVEIKAAAAGHFQVSSMTAPSAPFGFAAKSPTTLPAMAMGNAANTLTFSATVTPPASTAPGEIEAKVVLVSDIPNDKMHDVVLTAEVLAGGVGAFPQSMDFGGILKNTLSSAMATEVRNCSDAPLAITDVRIEGPNAADFSIVIPGPTELTRTLQPRESVKYHVVMRSEKPGAKVATLVIASATSSTQVALLATALGAGDGDATGSRSYYTGWCATSGVDASYGMLVLGVVFLLRRRRRK